MGQAGEWAGSWRSQAPRSALSGYAGAVSYQYSPPAPAAQGQDQPLRLRKQPLGHPTRQITQHGPGRGRTSGRRTVLDRHPDHALEGPVGIAAPPSTWWANRPRSCLTRAPPSWTWLVPPHADRWAPRWPERPPPALVPVGGPNGRELRSGSQSRAGRFLGRIDRLIVSVAKIRGVSVGGLLRQRLQRLRPLTLPPGSSHTVGVTATRSHEVAAKGGNEQLPPTCCSLMRPIASLTAYHRRTGQAKISGKPARRRQ